MNYDIWKEGIDHKRGIIGKKSLSITNKNVEVSDMMDFLSGFGFDHGGTIKEDDFYRILSFTTNFHELAEKFEKLLGLKRTSPSQKEAPYNSVW